MAKIALIGAGSIIFSTTLMNDLLQVKSLEGSTYALMGPTLSKLQKVEEYTNKLIKKNGLKADVYSTTDRRDALTGAVCTLKEIRDMTIELFEAHEKWLPQFKGKKPRKLEIIDTKSISKPAEVPLDPALAIANRFGKLAG